MIYRRELIKLSAQSAGLVLLAARCGQFEGPQGNNSNILSGHNPTGKVILYDTHAMALYFDGGVGPKTGVIKVDYIIKNEPVEFTFWHGHGGVSHKFTVLPEHFADLKKLKRVTITTTVVDGHSHKLFIDPVDPTYRVQGAQPVEVEVD